MSARELARQLWDARCSGTVIDVATITAPASPEEAYAVQTELTALSGAVVRGFKVGSTSKEAQRFLGTDEPGSGPLLAPFILASPASVPISALHMPAVEGEFAFQMGADLPPRAALYTRHEISEAVAAVAGAIEVVGTRFKGGLAGKGRLLTTADGGVNIALVLGRWATNWQALDLPAHRVAMSIDGEKKGAGQGARALDDPMNVMLWLVNQQSKLGRGLKSGDIISTGTCTGLDAVLPGNRASADFGSLGVVDITFSAL